MTLFTEQSSSTSASSQVLLLEGFIKFCDNKKWKSRWAIISKLSPIADCLQIILYKNFKEKMKCQQPKMVLEVEHYLGIESGFTYDKESNTMAIICVKQTIVLAFETREILLQWQTKIQDHFCKERHFSVHVVNVPKNNNNKVICCGPARLLLQDSIFCLVSEVPPRLNFYWSIKQLRRFGVVDGKFCFEGGSHCGKGAGLHVLYTSQAEELSKDFELASNGQLNILSKNVLSIEQNNIEQQQQHKTSHLTSVTSSDSSTGDSSSQMMSSTFEMDALSSNYYIDSANESNHNKAECYHSSINLNQKYHNLHTNGLLLESSCTSNGTCRIPATRTNPSTNGSAINKCSFSSNTISRFSDIKPSNLLECSHHHSHSFKHNHVQSVCRHTSSSSSIARPKVKHSFTASTIVPTPVTSTKIINCDHESPTTSQLETTIRHSPGLNNPVESDRIVNGGSNIQACYDSNHNYAASQSSTLFNGQTQQQNLNFSAGGSLTGETQQHQNGQVPLQNQNAIEPIYQRINLQQKKAIDQQQKQKQMAMENYDVPKNLCIHKNNVQTSEDKQQKEELLLMNHCVHCHQNATAVHTQKRLVSEQPEEHHHKQNASTEKNPIMDLDVKICSKNNNNNSPASGLMLQQSSCCCCCCNSSHNCFQNETTQAGTCGPEQLKLKQLNNNDINSSSNGYNSVSQNECGYLSSNNSCYDQHKLLPMHMTAMPQQQNPILKLIANNRNYENMHFINTMQLYENMKFTMLSNNEQHDPSSIETIFQQKRIPDLAVSAEDPMLDENSSQKPKFLSNNNDDDSGRVCDGGILEANDSRNPDSLDESLLLLSSSCYSRNALVINNNNNNNSIQEQNNNNNNNDDEQQKLAIKLSSLVHPTAVLPNNLEENTVELGSIQQQQPASSSSSTSVNDCKTNSDRRIEIDAALLDSTKKVPEPTTEQEQSNRGDDDDRDDGQHFLQLQTITSESEMCAKHHHHNDHQKQSATTFLTDNNNLNPDPTNCNDNKNDDNCSDRKTTSLELNNNNQDNSSIENLIKHTALQLQHQIPNGFSYCRSIISMEKSLSINDITNMATYLKFNSNIEQHRKCLQKSFNNNKLKSDSLFNSDGFLNKTSQNTFHTTFP